MSTRRPGDLMHADLTPTWLDRVAVNRCLDGLPVGRELHHAEKLAVARAVHADGGSTNRLAGLLGCSADLARDIRQEASCSD